MGWPWAPLTAVWALGVMGATALRIGAFNVQSFGDNKVSDPDCGSVIAQILAGYDIALVQESVQARVRLCEQQATRT
uniref:Deoxyribonuclease 1-like 2 n=1 Tax=Mus musculus TaxID=10090 RepID=D6RJ55_MOUSE